MTDKETIDKLVIRVERLLSNVKQLDKCFSDMENRIEMLDTRFDPLNEDMDKSNNMVSSAHRRIDGLVVLVGDLQDKLRNKED